VGGPFIWSTFFFSFGQTKTFTKVIVQPSYRAVRLLRNIDREAEVDVRPVRFIKRVFRAVAPPALFISLTAYFGWNALHGAHAGKTGRAINVKKGQFLAPWDMKNVAEKIASTGNERIMLCDRGTSFGYNTLVSDMRGLPIMAETGYPVVFDATHSVQQPGGLGTATGGQREFVEPLARAALSIGVAVVFIETHQDPDHAPSDGPTMVPLKEMKGLLTRLKAFDALAKSYSA